jgi:PAS domain S-box-containing protein
MISVLYVDDERDIIEVVQLSLEKTGDIRVTAVTSAQDALSKDIQSFDAIVSDYLMPGMDGIAFLKTIRQQYGDIPFILFTGHGREEVVIEAINNGADSYLQKGGDPDAQFAELAHRIRQAVRRKEADSALQEKERKFQSLFTHMIEGAAVHDLVFDDQGVPLDYVIVDVNPAFEKQLDLRRDQVIGKTSREAYGVSDPPYLEQYAKIALTGEAGVFETYFPPMDKYFSISAYRMGEGRFATIFEDITQRKLAEKTLQASEEKFRGMAERISDIVLLVDKDFRLTYASPSFLKLSGKRYADFLGMPLQIDSLTPREQEMVLAAFEENRNLKPTGPLEIMYHVPGKGSLILEFHGVPIQQDGVFQGVQLLAHDITSLRRTQDELRSAYEQLAAAQEELRGQYEEIAKSRREVAESEEQYKTLFEGANAAIFIANRKTFLNCNHSAEVLFGCLRDQLINNTILDFSPEYQPDGRLSRETARERIDAALSGTPQIFEWVHLRYDRTPFDAEISLNRVLIRGVYYIQGIVRDITGRKKAESALRESERKFSTVFKNSPVAHTLVMAADGTFVDVNDAFVRGTGYKREEVIGRTAEHLQLFSDPAGREKLIGLLRDRKEIDGMEVSCRVRSGEIRACLFSARPIRMMGKPHILATLEDITERKKAEDALKESEELFRAVSEYSHNAICIVSEQGKITWANDQALALGGYTREQIYAAPSFAAFVAPESCDWVLANFKKFVAGEPYERQYQFTIIRADGEKRLCTKHMTDFSDRRGKRNLVINMLDITEQTNAEEALKESESKLRRITDNAPDMIYRMSVPDRKFEYISPASLGLTGYTPREFYENPELLKKLIHPSWKEYFRMQWDALMAGSVPPTYEFQIINRAGQTRWFNQRNMLVRDSEGRTVAIEGIITDITRQKETERELRRNELRSLAVSANAGSWIWEVDANGMYCYSSPAVMNILGYKPEEIVGRMYFYELFDPSIREQLTREVFAIMEGREPFRNLENLNVHKDGRPVLLRTGGTPVFDETGAFAGYCGVDEDITEQRATEAAFQAIVKSMVGTTGPEALWQIAGNVSSWLGTECVMVGEIQPDRVNVRVLAMVLDGKRVEDFSYALKGTPCEDVKDKGFCYYPDNAVTLFPNARDIVALNMRSYVGTPLRDSDGNVFGILCALSRNTLRAVPSLQEIVDIIAVKAAAEIKSMQMTRALRESEAKYRLLAENVHDVIFTATMDMRLTYISPSVEALRGLTAEESMKESLSAAITPASFEVMMRSRELGLESLKEGIAPPSSTMELEFYRKDGATVWTETIITLAYDCNKKPIGVVGVIRDITQRKQVENALMESEEKFRALVETTPGIIWETDTMGRFLYISPMVEGILGYDPEQLIGESFKGLVIEQLRPILMRTLASMSASSHSPLHPFEVIARHRDGRDLVMEIRPSRVTALDGKVTGFRGVAYDTTRRKKAEEALKRANRQLNLLGSITRHDLLNKITVILGNLRIVEKRCTDPDEEDHLRKIRYATNAIKSQIEFTRIYQNLGTHEPQWIALNSVMPHPHVPPSVTLKTSVDGVEILADPMLEKVFFNLIDNSVRHGERVTKIHVTTHPSGDDMVIVWEDNGAGIIQEDKDHIFDRNFGRNTGLGMFLAREILSLTNILIRENGEPGRGARFEITVPKGAYRTQAHKKDT